MSELVQLDQALFGYRDGHNLLAASTTLAPRVRQFLATVTDSSGPENVAEFDVCFTGMPVPESSYYALFCTWPAPEMPRPGCVWSQVLLIQLTDLARISSLRTLEGLFCRPSPLTEIADYQKPIKWELAPKVDGESAYWDESRVQFLMRALYESPSANVVILDASSAEWVKPILAVWEQQWPRLRREFSFSSASLSDRSLAGVHFDVQIAPLGSERLWRRSVGQTLLLNFPNDHVRTAEAFVPEWLIVAKHDLNVNARHQLRRFLFDFGSDVESPREAFKSLASTYQKLRSAPNVEWRDLLITVGKLFSSKNDAARLKRTLLSRIVSPDDTPDADMTLEFISFLLFSDESSAYPLIDFDYARLAHLLWHEKRESTLSLLSHISSPFDIPVAANFVEAISTEVDANAFAFIAERNTDVATALIRNNHLLASQSHLWTLSRNVQERVIATLKELSLEESEWGEIVGAMLVAATEVAVREAVDMARQAAINGAFRWLESDKSLSGLPSPRWRDSLALSASEALNRFNALPPARLALCAWCVNTYDALRAISPERPDVQRLANELAFAVPTPLQLHTSSLLLTAGLRGQTRGSTNLILKSFFVVHEALANDAYPAELWSTLERELPSLWWGREWDRCKRLRRAVHYSLAEHGEHQRLRELARTEAEHKIARKVADGDIDDLLSDLFK